MTGDSQGKRILLVDDDAVSRTMAAQALERAGFRVSEASDGGAGLACLADSAADLVLLDVVMPGIDGFEVCRRLRATPGGANLPVVMLTGLDDSESIKEAYQAGASDFITKPINWSLLVHRVRFNLRAASVRAQLVTSQRSLDSAQRLARLGSWEWWPRESRFACSDEFARLMGLEETAIHEATPLSLVACAVAEDRDALQEARFLAAKEGIPYQVRYRCRGAKGSELIFEETGQATFNAAGGVEKLEAIVRDVTEAVANEERVRYLSYHDLTTGLPNRQFFIEAAGHTLDQARRNNSQCALLVIDLDHLKEINTHYGHAVGDRLLRIMAGRIVQCVRAADAAGIAHTPEGVEVAARAGGDQFVVLLSQLRRETEASAVADRLLEALRDPLVIDGAEIALTASIGLALFPRDSGSIAELLDHAEHGLNNARRLGRDVYAFYNEDVGQIAGAKLQLEGELRRAIANGGLVLHYQPKVDMESGRVVGAEALVRWQHPQRGLLPPAEFIPLAEECGLIIPMGHRIFQLACDQLQAWRTSGILGSDCLPLAVNLSALSFIEEHLLDQLLGCVASRGLPPSAICLEVTETSLMQQLDLALPRLEALRGAGFQLALDDFGTGYSSLNYLKRFPIHQLKIDRSFVNDITTDDQDVAIVGAIIALARKFGLEVVAEGVETKEQAKLLVGMGCTTAQGYLFARPMPAEELTAILANPGRRVAAASPQCYGSPVEWSA